MRFAAERDRAEGGRDKESLAASFFDCSPSHRLLRDFWAQVNSDPTLIK